MKKLLKWLNYSVVIFVTLTGCITITLNLLTKASNNRDWNNDQAVLPYAEISNNLASIYNIRNFSYTSTSDYTPNYYDKTFDLNKLKKAWYIVEPFSGIPGSAHTFLSFEFEDDQFVAISVEIRKEKGESFNPIVGLFNQYEIMYVIADERDAIKLRSNYRKDEVYLYPTKTTQEKTKALFLDMLNRANSLREHPEFYNTIVNNCTTNIVDHVNKITPNKVPFFTFRVLLPANSDKLAYKLGLIDTDLSFKDARSHYFINDRATKYATDPEFSKKIRP